MYFSIGAVSRRGVAALALLTILSLCGCSRGGRITATVTLDDGPLTNAQVTLLSENNSAADRFRGTTSADGTLDLPLPGEPDLPPGRYKVLVIKEEMKRGRKSPEEMKNDPIQLRTMGLTVNSLPARYADPSKTPLSAEVLAGANTLRFSLTSR